MNDARLNNSFVPALGGDDLQLIPAKAPPLLVTEAGPAACFAWDEFVYGKLRNAHTRTAYCRATRRFLAWCEASGVLLHQISPAHVGQYLDRLSDSVASKKVYLAAIRHLFDQLVTRHVVVLNPAASVRGERYQVIEGKTPEISVIQARELLASINTMHVVGLRDRSIISLLVYTAARIGALAGLRNKDFYDTGDQFCLRFTDKGGKDSTQNNFPTFNITRRPKGPCNSALVESVRIESDCCQQTHE